MKAVIFAGGVGTRLWPLSRKKSPKQFEKIIGSESTLQLTVSRLSTHFKPEDIFISTGSAYEDIISYQLPQIPKENILGEPYKKDVGPAVAVVMQYLAKKYDPQEPVVILWSDHLVKNTDKFLTILTACQEYMDQKKNGIIFIGQKPRFASDNLGWIEYDHSISTVRDIDFHSFVGFQYKPDKDTAQKFFTSGQHCWNLGYFVSTPEFILDMYKRFSPEIFDLSAKIFKDEANFRSNFEKYYNEMPNINFDNAVLEQLEPTAASVVVEDIGWSDVGAWEALKEALEKSPEDNITYGNVLLEDVKDALVYNYEGHKMIVGVDLEDLLVVNTPDVLLVANKKSVGKIKKLVENFQGTDKEHLT